MTKQKVNLTKEQAEIDVTLIADIAVLCLQHMAQTRSPKRTALTAIAAACNFVSFVSEDNIDHEECSKIIASFAGGYLKNFSKETLVSFMQETFNQAVNQGAGKDVH